MQTIAHGENTVGRLSRLRGRVARALRAAIGGTGVEEERNESF